MIINNTRKCITDGDMYISRRFQLINDLNRIFFSTLDSVNTDDLNKIKKVTFKFIELLHNPEWRGSIFHQIYFFAFTKSPPVGSDAAGCVKAQALSGSG